jgi:putative ABC transport system substrate-binding protein
MRRRDFITLIGGSAAAWPLAARAQQPARYRIGHLAIAAPTDTPPPPPANWGAFVQGLREAGYTEGQNIAFEHRSAHDQPELFPKLAFELASLKVDAIFARGTWALAAAKNATRMIPIVGIDLEIDPVEAGLVASIARPGGNITGLFLDLSEVSGKHLQILKEHTCNVSGRRPRRQQHQRTATSRAEAGCSIARPANSSCGIEGCIEPGGRFRVGEELGCRRSHCFIEPACPRL